MRVAIAARVRRVLGSARRRIKPTPRPGIRKRDAIPFLPPDPVIVEAGAHVGLDTVELSRLWPAGVIHAFEPIPHIYRSLETRTQELSNVKCHQLALGAINGSAPMWVSESATEESSSLLDPKKHLDVWPDVRFRTQLEVPVMTLDDWAQHEGIPRVDFLWLDMQGMELAMLQRSTRLLPMVKAMILEVFLEELYAGAPLWPDVRAWLNDRDFNVVKEQLGASCGDVLVARGTRA